MAVLTTVEGAQMSFKPDALAAVVDHDAITGAAVTCVYGIANSAVRISEPVDSFLGRLGIVDKFARLTRANGAPIWVNGAAVTALRAPLPDEYAATVNAVISVGSLTQGVTESLAAASSAINAHGGSL